MSIREDTHHVVRSKNGALFPRLSQEKRFEFATCCSIEQLTLGARKTFVPTIVSNNTRIVNISPKMLQPKSMEQVDLLSMMVETDTLLSVLAREVERQMGGDCHVVGFFQKYETENRMDPRQSVGDYDLGKGETIYVLFRTVPPTEQAVAVEEQAAAVAEETEEETEETEEAVEEAEEAVEEAEERIRIVKQPYKCGYCEVTGHNKRTCRLKAADEAREAEIREQAHWADVARDERERAQEQAEAEQAVREQAVREQTQEQAYWAGVATAERAREQAEAEQAREQAREELVSRSCRTIREQAVREEQEQAWWADMSNDLSETRETREQAEAEQARERRNRAYWADVATAERAREQAEAEQAQEPATFFCPVCMDDTEQSMKAPMPCSHDLCVGCYQGIISHQLNQNCPCCRAPFVDLVSTVVQPVPVPVVAAPVAPAQPRRRRPRTRRNKCSICREEGHNKTRCPYANAGSALGHYGIRVSDLQYGVGGPPDPASGW